MIFCTLLIFIISGVMLVAPLRQLSAYLGKEETRLRGDAERLPTGRLFSWRLRTFGALVRDENHPQHRLAAQVALLLAVVLLTVLMLLRILAAWR
ncbi:MAG: hypothetical protein ABIY70_04260 [Capsulimonas sp.]|uniref:hypothetical protein n=1 Tax=Capsulimonas sp. TaxID=2494211 RepID=UPI003263190D